MNTDLSEYLSQATHLLHRHKAACVLAAAASLASAAAALAQTNTPPPSQQPGAAAASAAKPENEAHMHERWRRAHEEAAKRENAPKTEQQLKYEAAALERAKARWELINAKRYEESYEFLSAGSRLVLSKEQYVLGQQRLGASDGQATRARCTTEGRCEVDVRYTSSITIPHVGKKQLPVFIAEAWEVIDGTPYLRAH